MENRIVKHADHQRFIEEGFRKGDQSRIRELYESFADNLINWVKKNSGDQADAEDLFQEAMLVLVVKSIDPNFELSCSIKVYLYSICYRKWMKVLHNNKKKLAFELDFEPERFVTMKEIDQAIQEAACFQLLDRKFLKLSTNCQELLKLVRIGKSTKELLTSLKIEKTNALYQRKNKCIKRWRSLLEKEDQFENCKEIML